MISQSMITVQVVGGLGNQLHGYACGIALAGELRRKLIVDTSRVSFGSNLARTPALEDLEMPDYAIEISFSEDGYSWMDFKYEKLRRHSRGYLKPKLKFEEPDYWDSFEEPSLQISKITENTNSVGGSFMNFTWASRALPFGFPKECNPAHASYEYSTEVSQLVTSDIALHIRIGDYLKHQDIFPIVSEEYYLEALVKIPNSDNKRIFIFTDSPNLINKFYPRIVRKSNVRIVRNQLTALETMSLMSKFRYLIASNSTFSSWAGWFSEKETVITPTPHHKNAWSDYLPADWIRLPISNN
jgi:hypothetical protein